MTRAFTFTESWEVPFPAVEVAEVLLDLEHYPSWWPQVRAVAKIDDDTARVLCRSTLPYTLDLVLTAVSRGPSVLSTTIEGDLVGSVSWTLSAESGGTRLDYLQEVDVGHPLLARLADPLRGVLTWNHGRMMAGCRVGLAGRLSGSEMR